MTSRQRRFFHGLVLAVWLLPGAVATYYLRDSIPWIQFMSWFAIVYTCAAAVSAETPVEEE